MKRESVWRVATLPVVALLLTVSVFVVAIGVRHDAQMAGKSVPSDRQTVVDLRSAAEVNTKLLNAMIVVWTTSMGHPADVDAAVDQARSAMAAARRSPTLRSLLAPSATKLGKLHRTATLKQHLDLLRETHSLFLSVLPTIENRLGTKVLALRVLTGRRLTLGDLYSKLTAKRSLLGVDTAPAESFMTVYMSGLVATDVQPPADLNDVLTSNVSLDDQRASLAAVARDPALAPLNAAIRWSVSGDTNTKAVRGGTTYADLASAHAAAVKRIDGLLADEFRRLDRGLRSTQRRSETVSGLALVVMVLALLGALTTFGWLLRRLRRSMSALRALAETDTLTGVLNRSGLRRVIEPWFVDRSSSSVALAVVDLDKFKSINDEHGHGAGDAVLASVAQRLLSATIPDTTAVGRWGGDEYVLAFRLPAGATASSVEQMVGRIQASIGLPIAFEDSMLAISATIGIATCACASCDFDDLFRVADHSLYAGKFAGRNRFTSVDCHFDIRNHLGPVATSSSHA